MLGAQASSPASLTTHVTDQQRAGEDACAPSITSLSPQSQHSPWFVHPDKPV